MSGAANELVLILDFGSQFTQLIARRVREMRVYCEIHPCDVDYNKIAERNIRAIVLSGGPASVLEPDSPSCDARFLRMEVPVLGICYGMQLLARDLGGKLARSTSREFGRAVINVTKPSALFKGSRRESTVWMSHGDSITEAPAGFEVTASTNDVAVAAMENRAQQKYGLHFHPEVVHTEEGKKILGNFLFDIGGLKGDWTMSSFIERTISDMRTMVGDDKVILGISGGVDSAVTGLLLQKAIGKSLVPVFVDNGLLRLNEENEVLEALDHLDLHVKRAQQENPNGFPSYPRNQFAFNGFFRHQTHRPTGTALGWATAYHCNQTLFLAIVEYLCRSGPLLLI